MSGPYRLGVDVGGTHTDLVLLNIADGSIEVEKVSSTPSNPALGVLDGLLRTEKNHQKSSFLPTALR